MLSVQVSLGEGKVFLKFRHTEQSEVSQTNQEKSHICRTLQKQQNKLPSTFEERVAHFHQISMESSYTSFTAIINL